MTEGLHGDDYGSDSIRPPGVARRSAVALTWLAPVVATATTAPAAVASPQLRSDGTFIGLFADRLEAESPRRFVIRVLLNGNGALGAPVVLDQEAAIRITSAQDIAVWSEAIIPDGPRSGVIRIPAGVYPGTASFTVGDRTFVSASPAPWHHVASDLAADPSGRFRVDVVVERGPGYRGANLSEVLSHGGYRSRAVLLNV